MGKLYYAASLGVRLALKLTFLNLYKLHNPLTILSLSE